MNDSFARARELANAQDVNMSPIARILAASEKLVLVLMVACQYPPHNYVNRPRDANGNCPKTKYQGKDKQVWVIEYDEEKEEEVKDLLPAAIKFIREKVGNKVRLGTVKDPELDKGAGFQQYKTNCDTHLVVMSGISQVVLGVVKNFDEIFGLKLELPKGTPEKSISYSVRSLLKEVTYTTNKGTQSPVFYCLAGDMSIEYVGMCVAVPMAEHMAANFSLVMCRLVELNITERHIQLFLSKTFSTHQVRIALELTYLDHATGEITVIGCMGVKGDEAMEIQQLQAEDWVDMSILTDGPSHSWQRGRRVRLQPKQSPVHGLRCIACTLHGGLLLCKVAEQ